MVGGFYSTCRPVTMEHCRGLHQNLSCFMPFAVTWKRGQHNIIRLALDTTLGGQSIHSRAGMPFRGIRVGWRNGTVL